MRKFIKRAIINKTLAKLLIKPILRCHSKCYALASRYSVILNNGIHPKHRILKYKEWFLENIEPGWTILDIGFNTGMLPCMLAQKAKFVYGIEINDEYVSIAKTRYANDNIEYICADATTYNYASCKLIDCITMSNVLEHIEGRVDFLKRIIRQVNWAREEQKRFLFRVPQIDREWLVLYKKEMGVEYRLDSTHYIEYTLESFTKEMDEAGIRIINADTHFAEIYAVCEASSELRFSHTK
jgi:ubiquinone/menaquinone biosynthesis C-methylase UbiE